jgi:RNA polymerase sigma-70 factor (ECF subfamily)
MPETTLGGPIEAFPETLWTSILSAPEPVRQERLLKLLERTWRPVYRFIRVAWKKNIEESKDLAQEFFAHLLQTDFLGKYRREQGRFRTFLIASLKNFLAGRRRDEGRLKRGGGQAVLSMNLPETDVLPPDPSSSTPEEHFDREWARGVMAECLAETRRALAEEGRELYFKIFETYDLADDSAPRPTYKEMAETLGITVHDVRNHLAYARGRLRKLTVERLRETVASAEDLQAEIDELSRYFRG